MMNDEEALSGSPGPFLASPSSPYCGMIVPKAGEEFVTGEKKGGGRRG